MSSEIFHAILWLLLVFLFTSSGAAVACLFSDRAINYIFTYISGFSGGIMIAASVWSLLIPAMETSSYSEEISLALAVGGFALGAAFMFVVSKFLPEEENPARGSFKRLFIAVTAHNIPEGLAVGFAFGGVAFGKLPLAAAIAVALGIGIQNFPEGAAVSMPARKVFGKGKAFLYGAASGAVEPIAGLIGFFAVGIVSEILPVSMAFAAGAMVFATISDVLPGALNKNAIQTSAGFSVGFILMMTLDVLFG
ncbi:MAG: ZIP family metal transporter [Clostridia bacterium]|nr:ZIP family metal transporter [Clostridia bacterium]